MLGELPCMLRIDRTLQDHGQEQSVGRLGIEEAACLILVLTEALQAFETSALDVRLPAEAAIGPIVHRLLLHFLGLRARCPREGRLRRPRTTEDARP